MSDVDRLVELITQRVQERMQGTPRAKLNVLPRDRGPCDDDSAPGEDCASCGSCVVRRPWSVRAAEDVGMVRIGAALGRRRSSGGPREADRSHAAQGRGHARRDRQAVRRSAQISLRFGVREHHVGAAVQVAARGLGRDGVHGRRLSARRDDADREGVRGARCGACRRARSRHGDQHRRAQVEGLRDRVRGHLSGRQGVGAGGGQGHPRDQRADAGREDRRLARCRSSAARRS